MTHIKIYVENIEGDWRYIVLFDDDSIHYEPTFDDLVEYLRPRMTVGGKQ